MKSDRDYLLDMLEYIGHLETFAAEGRAKLNTDIKTQLAVRKAYEVLGEIAKRLPDDLLSRQPHIPWKALKGLRDVLSHQYDGIDLNLVWDAVEDLPALRAAVEALIASLPDTDKQ
jgi:uncharacterized protein with HEPN domain